MTSLSNPFITTGYHGRNYFCDREDEAQTLLDNISNGRSTTLTSIRRIGKTGLIKHVLANLPPDQTGIYIDILPTENLNEFLNVLASSVFNTIPEKSTPGKKILDFIKSLRPVITYDPLSGHPQVTFDVRPGETTRNIASVFQYLENFPQKVVVAIDEFQQILQYPEKNTDSWLRSIIQSLNNVRFIFAGSQQHLMTELFADPSRPFFQSAGFLKIGKISREQYSTFISDHFQKAGKQISAEVINEILDWTDVHTYYVQLLCNRVYAMDTQIIITETWKDEAARLLQEEEIIFFKYRDLLTKQQWFLLKSIAHEGEVYSPTSKDFISKYVLGSSATVLRSLHALLSKEMIYSDYNPEGRMFYSVYDVLFRRWMQRF
ncbi:MAG: ATP-binding protein [Bacteroidales bacterium]|nr:ATP-binding protein [Bacteroidales bacterium]